MKKLLIISPYFPPTNTPDMQRVRMSLPYLNNYGWEAEVVTVSEEHSDLVKDALLPLSVPKEVLVHKVSALPKKITSKIGLGSIALRSLFFYFKAVNRLLKANKYDLIYFSTTQFPVCILGTYWKKKFHIPYVIDMQDPWHTEYYQGKPKSERPSKYWFSYRLNKFLEPLAMKHCDGLISVSLAYVKDLQERYSNLAGKPYSVITFGAYKKDFEMLADPRFNVPVAFEKGNTTLNIVYIGVSGTFMRRSLGIIFSSFKRGLQTDKAFFSQFRFIFLGTSYAPAGKGVKSVLPVAKQVGVEEFVVEQTERIPFYQVLASLHSADGLLIPGTDDQGYTASKLYPYILAKKPILGVFHPQSNAVQIMKECNAGKIVELDYEAEDAYNIMVSYLHDVKKRKAPQVNWEEFEKYSANTMTKKQVALFDCVLQRSNIDA